MSTITGLLYTNQNELSASTITAESPISVNQLPRTLSFNNSINSTLNTQRAVQTTDESTTAVAPAFPNYSQCTPLVSEPYTPASPNDSIQIRFIVSYTCESTSTSAVGATIFLFTKNTPTATPIFSVCIRPYTGSGTSFYTASGLFIFDQGNITIPEPLTFYLAGMSASSGNVTFISNSSSVFGGLAPNAITLNSIV